jgi:hypothetical protein
LNRVLRICEMRLQELEHKKEKNKYTTLTINIIGRDDMSVFMTFKSNIPPGMKMY